MSGQLSIRSRVVAPDKAAIRKRDREADKSLTELHGVQLGMVWEITDKRYEDYGYRIAREVIGLRVKDGKPAALLTGFVTTWIKIDEYKGIVNGYRLIN